jgi:hypothetical protein
MADRAGYEFGGVEIEDEACRPILTFVNEACGHAFEESDQDLLIPHGELVEKSKE